MRCCVSSRRWCSPPTPTQHALLVTSRSTVTPALPNYRNNWIRLGFSDDEIEQRDHRFVDAVVVWGDEDRVRAGVQAHYDAGADHVCVQPVNPDMSADIDWNALELLAPTD